MKVEDAKKGRVKSPCCDARTQVMYGSVMTVREALVYMCLKCSRLHVVDSRDEKETP